MILDLGLAARIVAGIRTHTAQREGCPEWDTKGIAKALSECEGTPGAVLAAACLAAEDASLRLPSVAGFRNHWPVNAASSAPRVSMTQRCPEHPEHDMPHDHGGDMTREQITAAAAEIRAQLLARRPHRFPTPGVVKP